MIAFYLVTSAIISFCQTQHVIHLKRENFNTIVDGSRNVLVDYEYSWTSHFQSFAKILQTMAETYYSNIDGETVLAVMETSVENSPDCVRHKSSPTIKLFLKGRSQEEAIYYNGRRKPMDLKHFIDENISKNNLTLPAEKQIIKPSGKLSKSCDIFIKEEYSKFSSDGSIQHEFPEVDTIDAKRRLSIRGAFRPALIVFYSPDCPNCQEFMPLMEEYTMSRNRAVMMRINGEKNTEFRDFYNITSYPSIIGIHTVYSEVKNDGRWTRFPEDKGIDDLDDFIHGLDY